MQINNIEGYFIIDTGASNSCVGFKHKDFFKLEKFVKSYSASGAGSEKFDAYKTKKAFVSHNGNKIEKINFLLIEMDSINEGQLTSFAFDNLGIRSTIYSVSALFLWFRHRIGGHFSHHS